MNPKNSESYFNSLSQYLKEISKYPLLSKEEERELTMKSYNGDWGARVKLINSNLRLVVFRAKKYSQFNLSLLDLIGEGNSGLIKAADRYNPEKFKTKFSTYSTWWIDQAILKALNEQADTIRFPTHFHRKKRRLEKIADYEAGLNNPSNKLTLQERELSKEFLYLSSLFSEKTGSLNSSTFEDLEVLDTIPDTYDLPNQAIKPLIRKQIYFQVKEVLNAREFEIIKYRFGLDDLVPLTLEQLGQKFKITRERVRQIEEKTLLKLAPYFKDFKIE